MKYQVLARKWRPRNFSEVVGQDHIVTSLTNALQHDRLHHAYLFTGTRGVGKTTIARILAKAINCENRQNYNPCGVCSVCTAIDQGRFLDLIEVDAASRTKVEDTRDLLDNAQYAPNHGRYKVYLIDEVHMLSGHSFNALLKTLEEPPEHVKFLLATTDPHKIPITVLSRCLQFNLKQLLPKQIFTQMTYILEQEVIEFEPAAIRTLSCAADGSMRDGLSLLDRAIVFSNGHIRNEDINNMLGVVAQQTLQTLLTALADHDVAAIFDKITELCQFSPDFCQIVQQLLKLFYRLALLQQVPSALADDDDIHWLTELSTRFSAEDLQLFYQIALLGQRDLELAPDPRIGFEMLMLRMLTFKPATNENLVDSDSLKVKEIVPFSSSSVSIPRQAKDHLEVPILRQDMNWQAMIAAMKLESLTKQLANNCMLEQLDDSVCKLSLDPAHQNLLTTMRLEKLQKAIQHFRGTAVKLVINTEKKELDTPAIQQSKRLQDQQESAVEAIQSDTHVKRLIEQFDARILPDSIEPL